MPADQDAVNGRRDLAADELSGLDSDPTAPPTIYDVARAAGVSIASVSRVLNGQRNPRQETRERVLAAVADLGFVPDGAARALSGRLKEVVGVIVRRPAADMDEDLFADEAESLQYPDLINRGIETAAQRRGFDLLIRSVGITEHDPGGRTLALARKSDGLILHDRVLEPDQMDRLSRQLPIVTLAGYATPTTANVHGDNKAGMHALARHLLRDHGYRSLGYLGGYADSPDSIERQGVLAAEAAAAGAAADPRALREAAAQADQESSPPSDLHGAADYRRHLARVLTARALAAAAGV